MKLESLRKEVCDISLKAYHEGLFEGTCGNLSGYDKESGLVVITPSCVPYEDYSPEQMVVIDLDGNVVEGENRPSSEWIMHTMVYKEKPEVGGVMHTHSPYATSFAASEQPIPCIIIEMIPMLGGDIPLADFGMPGTAEVAVSAVKALKDRYGCLLASHGVLTIGDDVNEAFTRAGYLENSAKICSLAMASGMPISPLSKERFQAVKDHYDVALRWLKEDKE